MSENSRQLQALITELNKRREEYTREGLPVIQELYKTRGRRQKKPDVFNDSSFLYIRTYDGDLGNRPLPTMNFWNSPDISFMPVTGTTPLTTNELRAGESYLVRCHLHNRGDVTVPYPKVEFWLTDPSLGFDTRFSSYVGVTQMNGLLLANGVGEAQFVYRVPPEESGHKCFFARTFSFSPLDKPHDVYALDPVTDRHIGQKNLNIVAQATAYRFNLIHMANTEEIIQFVPLTTKEIIGLGTPALGKLQFIENRSAAIFYRQEIKLLHPNQNVHVKNEQEGFRISAQGEGPGVREQAKIMQAFTNAIKRIGAGKAKPSEFKELFAEKRKMNDFIQKTSLNMTLPQLELKRDEAMAFHIINTNTTTGIVKGGITLVITGMG
ncbi:MAG: hypothetical protein JWQ14_3221 [Adhaeribacter sp.]|nr:hypothetical protein [Adhaeribacter sp.]